MMTKERLAEITRNDNHLACVSESAIDELVEAARDSIRYQEALERLANPTWATADEFAAIARAALEGK